MATQSEYDPAIDALKKLLNDKKPSNDEARRLHRVIVELYTLAEQSKKQKKPST